MKKNLLAQMTVSAMLMISLAACQKHDDNKAPEAAPAAPTEAPKAEMTAKQASEFKLSEIGLRFIDKAPAVEPGEDPGYESTAAWDTKFYREFLEGLQAKHEKYPTLEKQVEVLENFVEVNQNYLEELSAKPEDTALLQERNSVMDHVALAKKRLEKLVPRLTKKQGTNPDGAVTPVEEIKEDGVDVD